MFVNSKHALGKFVQNLWGIQFTLSITDWVKVILKHGKYT